jgi:hypothetical protein
MFIKGKKGIEIAMNTIIYAIIGIVVLVVLIMLFVSSLKPAGQLTKCAQQSVGQYECHKTSDNPLCFKAGCDTSAPYCCPKPESTIQTP